MLALSASGLLTLSSQVTPKIIHEQVDKGITPPAVELAVEKLIVPWEGLVLKSHWDRYAKIWDICYGETRINGKPVTAGMSFTKEQCKAMLIKRVIHDYYLPLVDKGKGFIHAPVSVQASMISGAYNFGVGSVNPRRGQLGSTAMVIYIPAGKWRQACEAQTAWNKAGIGDDRHVVPGLVKRREMGDAQRIGEAELCVSGL
ncbi:lysozyme [Mesorhizobium sp. M4B.F.Ca.ET.058.02.1.1]|uniref:lysozyme n=1 Tax=Mesorhizobium sp. M4B.F.Ca.ET.058.02.1.1 TaxID=2493675 RepID=UPI001FE08D86|nr:lysozyme [Mesorhizobium sp. M4B.F.Ca.ET.058.02.1.1]